jgi:hypothetical protein
MDIPYITEILAVYGGLVTIATVVTKLTPTPKDDAILAKVLAVVDLFSTAYPKVRDAGPAPRAY